MSWYYDSPRDPLAIGRSGALGWVRHWALRGRPLRRLREAEARIASRVAA